MKKIEIKFRDLHFTQNHIGIIILHIFFLVAISLIWSHLTWGYPRIFEIPISIGSWVAVAVVLFSLADYLDIIKYRKSHQRLNKCIICDRTNETNKFGEKSNVTTETVKEGYDPDGDKINEKFKIFKKTFKEFPELPLHGIIVYDKMICIECFKNIKEMFKE